MHVVMFLILIVALFPCVSGVSCATLTSGTHSLTASCNVRATRDDGPSKGWWASYTVKSGKTLVIKGGGYEIKGKGRQGRTTRFTYNRLFQVENNAKLVLDKLTLKDAWVGSHYTYCHNGCGNPGWTCSNNRPYCCCGCCGIAHQGGALLLHSGSKAILNQVIL